MADVELDDLGDRRNRRDVVIVEPVTRVHDEAECRGARCGRAHALDLARGVRPVRIRVGAGVNFHDGRAGGSTGIELREVGIDE